GHYNHLGIGRGLVTHGLSQFKNVGLDEIRLALQRLHQQLTLRVNNQLAATLFDEFAQLAIILEREFRRGGTSQNENIALMQVHLHAVKQAQEVCVLNFAAGFVDLGVPALRVNNL